MDDIADIRTLTVTELAFGGDGMAHDPHTGETIFIPYGLPGDVVHAKIVTKKSHQIWARMLDVIKPSPQRVATPPCAHCFDCGGCQLQHMHASDYQAWKLSSVLDRLAKGGLHPEKVDPLVVLPAHARRRATFAAARVRGQISIGFNRHHSDQIIDMQECHVLLPEIVAVLPALRRLLDVIMPAGAGGIDVSVARLETGLDVLLTGAIQDHLLAQEAMAEFVQTCNIARLSHRLQERAEAEILLQPSPARLHVGGVMMTPAPGSFLQPSVQGEAALVAAVESGVGTATQVVDLFAGMGTFTFPLARAGMRVRAVDADGPGLRALQAAAGNEGLTIQTAARNLYKSPLLAADFQGVDAIVFDPPRAGAKAQAPEIARSGVPRVVAVSCNPATFVVDAAPLLAAGYTFTRLTVIDQFTWSAHVEIVAVFSR